MNAKSMKSVMEEIRRKSPTLDQSIAQSRQRRDLALTLFGLRRRAGLTQVEVAARMGKDQAHVSRMESTRGPFPDSASIEAYAHACNSAASLVFVTGGEGPATVLTVALGEESEGDKLIEAIQSGTAEFAKMS
jgi:transcriptional regulator with XRE-family HTH domain